MFLNFLFFFNSDYTITINLHPNIYKIETGNIASMKGKLIQFSGCLLYDGKLLVKNFVSASIGDSGKTPEKRVGGKQEWVIRSNKKTKEMASSSQELSYDSSPLNTGVRKRDAEEIRDEDEESSSANVSPQKKRYKKKQ